MNKSLITGTLLSGSLLLLSSCAGFHRTVARVHSSMVGEAPYAEPVAAKAAPVPPQQTLSYKQKLAQWSPTLSSPPKPLPGYTPFPDQNHANKPAGTVRVNPRYESSSTKRTIKSAPKPKTKPARTTKSSTKPTPKPKAKPAPKAKPKAKPAPKAKTSDTKNRIYKVRYVPGKTTHVQHPHDRKTIIRITDKEGNKPAKGTIMRVPGENVRFYVP